MLDEYDTLEHLEHLQTAIYVAVGGGMNGAIYAEHPKSAYIDDRAGRRPYKAKDIEAMRRKLVETAERLGLDPDDLPPRPLLHNCGVF